MNRDDLRFLHEIGFRIREHRQALGWSQEELAKRVDLHRTYIGSVERGERNVSILNLRRIAKCLRVPLESIFDGSS